MSGAPRRLGRSPVEVPLVGLDSGSLEGVTCGLRLGSTQWPLCDPSTLPEVGPTWVFRDLQDIHVRPDWLEKLARARQHGRVQTVGATCDVSLALSLCALPLFDFVIVEYNPFRREADLELFWRAQQHECGVLVTAPTGLEPPLPSAVAQFREGCWDAVEAEFPEYAGHRAWLALQFGLHHPAVCSVLPHISSASEWVEWQTGMHLPRIEMDQWQRMKRLALG